MDANMMKIGDKFWSWDVFYNLEELTVSYTEYDMGNGCHIINGNIDAENCAPTKQEALRLLKEHLIKELVNETQRYAATMRFISSNLKGLDAK